MNLFRKCAMQLKCRRNVNKYGAGLPRHYNVVLAKEGVMKKAFLLLAIIVAPLALAACGGNCETEPIVEENHKLIVPPNFGQMPQ